MSEKIGPVYYNEREGYVSPQKQAEIDAEIRRCVFCQSYIQSLARLWCAPGPAAGIVFYDIISRTDILLYRLLVAGEQRVVALLKSKEAELHRVRAHL